MARNVETLKQRERVYLVGDVATTAPLRDVVRSSDVKVKTSALLHGFRSPHVQLMRLPRVTGLRRQDHKWGLIILIWESRRALQATPSGVGMQTTSQIMIFFCHKKP